VSLSRVLESRFRGDIRFRGAAYVQNERVEIAHVTPDRVYGVVSDTEEFQTQLSRTESQLVTFCTCAKPGQQEVNCKHVWATILLAEANGYMNGGVQPGFFPPFAASDEVLVDQLDGELFDDLISGDVFVPSAATTRRETPKPAPEQTLRSWERRFNTLREELDEGDLTSATTREREIRYELDVAASRAAGLIVVDVLQRQRRANGQWGKQKPLKLKPGKLDEVEREEDRRVLSMMGGGVVDRTNWFANQTEFQTAVYRYRIPAELGEELLPALCETSRFSIQDDEDTKPKPLKWDDGPPWTLSMAVVHEADDGHWTLAGRLSREGQEVVCDVRDAELVVPGGFVLRGRSIAHLEDFGAYEWIQLLQSETPIQVPDGDEADFVDQLLDMPATPRLELPEQLRLEEITPEPQPLLTVTAPQGRWRHERLRAEVSFDYGGTIVRASSRRLAIVQRGEGRCIVRDRQREVGFWRELEQHGFRRLLDRRRGSHDVEISVRELGPAVRQLIADKWDVQADGQQVRQAGQVQFRVNTAIDWFELHATVDFGGQGLALPELLAALSRGETTIRLGDGSLGILPEEWLDQYGLLAGLGTPEDEHLRFTSTQAGLLDALLSGQPDVDYDQQFLDLRDRMRSFDGVTSVAEPEHFVGELRGYQREGLGWLKFLQSFGFGGCLADDMGLGKTVQMLALLQERLDEGTVEQSTSLIVVPKSLMFNWKEEAERFTPNLQVLEYSGTERAQLRDEFHKYNIVLTTYGTLRRDILALKETRFDYIVLDEAQTIKNAASQIARASRLLQANHRIALSGTPIENHLGDLWSIFEFLNPGMLGRSSLFRVYAADAQNEESRGLLGHGLSPFILRRTKQQVANDLPEKVEQTIHCRMGKEQKRLYSEMRDHYRESLIGMVNDQGLAKTRMHVLEALLRLRQAACHPGLLDPARIGESSAKLDVLCAQIEELTQEGHKALIFSQFTSLLAIVRKHLDDRGIVYEYLDGQTRNRKQHVDRFQNDPDCPLFLISLKAGGLGLNLTAAEYVFLLDPWWNPAVEAQAIDRAHRVGQTRRVFAYRLICEDTVEEKIADLQRQKKDLADAILKENNSGLKNLTVEDLDMLLS
jgi:superfamily II DNA or RNA helicase